MYIKKIEFTNFRGFQELSIDLPENLAVFIGWNGSGKTTILDGIYMFLLGLIRELFDYKGRKANQALFKYLETRDENDFLEYDKYNEKYSAMNIDTSLAILLTKLITNIDNRYHKNYDLKIKITLFS